jgi:hypothetical protein
MLDRWFLYRDREYILVGILMVFGVGLALYFWSLLIGGETIRSTRVWILLLTSPIMLYGIYFVWIRQTFAWWVGTTQGRMAIAELQEVISRSVEGALRGNWRVYVDGQAHDVRFGVTSRRDKGKTTWVQTIQPGDRVYVLLHPKKNKVLLAYGPVEDTSWVQDG